MAGVPARAAPRVLPAVPARVAAPGPHHPPAAFGALLGVVPGVEERRLAGRRGRCGLRSLRGAAVRQELVALR